MGSSSNCCVIASISAFGSTICEDVEERDRVLGASVAVLRVDSSIQRRKSEGENSEY